MAGVIDVVRHAAILRNSYFRRTGKRLTPVELKDEAVAQWLDDAAFAVVSHDIQADPIFNYANRTALQLFGMTWADFTLLPSRLSAGPIDREARERLLAQVSRDGYIDNYAGIRVGAGGRRFMIRNATVWNLEDENGDYYGQAAMIPEWSDAV